MSYSDYLRDMALPDNWSCVSFSSILQDGAAKTQIIQTACLRSCILYNSHAAFRPDPGLPELDILSVVLHRNKMLPELLIVVPLTPDLLLTTLW